MELIKYYPRSQTVHIREDAPVGAEQTNGTLCGKWAAYAVITDTRDRLGMVNCKSCRAVFMDNLKAERDGTVPTVSPESDGLMGLLQAIALTAAGDWSYRRLMGIIVEAMIDGYRG